MYSISEAMLILHVASSDQAMQGYKIHMARQGRAGKYCKKDRGIPKMVNELYPCH